jgi:fructose-specific phosphotransferase system IIC component
MELFSPLHLAILLFIALIFGVPLLVLFLLARWLDKGLQRRSGIKVSFRGVVVGGIVDVVASGLLGVPLVIYVMVKHDLFHSPASSAAIASAVHASGWLYGFQLTIGLSCSVLGGYIAASIAKHDELLNGLLSSFLCTAIGVYSIFSGKASESVRAQTLLLIASPAFAFLGGYFRQRQKQIGRSSGITGPST